MHTPWMFITGASIVGFFLPEFFGGFGRVTIPLFANLLCALAFGLIAASFV